MYGKYNSYRQESQESFGANPSEHARIEAEIYNPADSEESPFRRTQRLLREASIGTGSEGYRSNSWKRVQNGAYRDGRKLEKPAMGCEIRNIYPSMERNYNTTGRAVQRVHAQYHGESVNGNDNEEYAYSGSLDTRLRKPVQRSDNEITLAETYSLPPPSRKESNTDEMLNMDSGDLYACVQKAMARLSEDHLDQIESRSDYTTV